MSLISGRKLSILSAVLVLSGVFLFVLSVGNALAGARNYQDFLKEQQGTLESQNWNDLLGYSTSTSSVYNGSIPLGNFVPTFLPATMYGPLGVNVAPSPTQLTIKSSGDNILGLLDSSGNELFSVLNSGNVGIGTTAPTATLDVNTTALINYNILAGGKKIGSVGLPQFDADAATKGYVDSTVASATSSITLWGGTVGGNIWNLNSGNVGIGTTNPLAKLDIPNDALTSATADNIRLWNNSAADAVNTQRTSPSLSFQSGGSGGTNTRHYWRIYSQTASGSTNGFLYIDGSLNGSTFNNHLSIQYHGTIPTISTSGRFSATSANGATGAFVANITTRASLYLGLQLLNAGSASATFKVHNSPLIQFKGSVYNASSVSEAHLYTQFVRPIESTSLSELVTRFSSDAGVTYGDAYSILGTYGQTTPTVNISNKLGIGLGVGISPTNSLSLTGQSAQTMWMERHAAANTAGNNLTLQAGGATSAAMDKNGGALNLSSGISTGAGGSFIAFLTAPSGSSGTTDNAPTEKMRIIADGSVGIGTTAPAARLEVDPASGYSILAGSTASSTYKIGNVAPPTENTDVATLGWVNSALASATSSMATMAVFVGFTSSTYNGSQSGYTGANALCSGTTGLEGSHVCTTEEVLYTINKGSGGSIPSGTTFWMSNGPPAYTANANDCQGWTSSAATDYGALWIKLASGDGFGSLIYCDSTYKFACCK